MNDKNRAIHKCDLVNILHKKEDINMQLHDPSNNEMILYYFFMYLVDVEPVSLLDWIHYS